MNDFLLVDVLESQQKLYEPLNDLLLAKRFVLLLAFFEELFQISFFCVLHYYADGLFLDEGLEISDDIAMVELLHEFDFL